MADSTVDNLTSLASPAAADLLYVLTSGGADRKAQIGALPVSTATQTALDGKQTLDSDLTAIAGLSPSNDDIMQRKSGAWINRTPAQVKTDLTLVKGDVGLSNVDNTSDASKPVSTATQTALDLKADTSTLAETVRDTMGTALVAGSGITITPNDGADTITVAATGGGGGVSSVGATAPITSTGGSTPTIAITAATTSAAGSMSAADKTKLDGLPSDALDPANNLDDVADWETARENLGFIVLAEGESIPGGLPENTVVLQEGAGTLDSDLSTIAGLTPSNDDLLQRKSGAWINRTPAQVKTDLALVKADVGLSNVDNTTDASKPVSTATQTALDGKQTLDSDLTAIAGLSPSNDDIIQRKSGAWINRTPAQVKTDLALVKADVGLSNVDNTSDASKPVSTATQTALDGKQTLDSDLTAIAGLSPSNDDIMQRKSGAWINRTPAQVKTDLALVKADVGLGSVDNTSDASKPVSTATQTALDGKVAKATMPAEIGMAVSDETTTITTGTAKVTFRMPFAMTLTAVRASLNTVSSSGVVTVDINDGGTTIMTTNKLSIDASEKTSTTAATAATLTDTALADDAEITIDIDAAGTGAKGLKVWLIGTRVAP